MIDENSTKEEVLEELEFARETLKRYREKLLEAVKEKRDFTNVIIVLNHDREMVLATVRENGHNLISLGAEWRGDREVVMEAVKGRGLVLKCKLT
jgi:predicted ATP-dependent Lon-type protease